MTKPLFMYVVKSENRFYDQAVQSRVYNKFIIAYTMDTMYTEYKLWNESFLHLRINTQKEEKNETY